MAGRDVALRQNFSPSSWAAIPFATWMAVSAVLLIAIAPLSILAGQAAGSGVLDALSDPVIWRAVRFTLWQAGLSTILSIGLAVPVAICVASMRSHALRSIVLVVFSIPLAIPQIVAVLAVVWLYGQSGLVATTAQFLGFSMPSIYGLGGILIAHVFYNLPLAVRFIDTAMGAIPPQYRRNADQLGMGTVDRMRWIVLPLIMPAVGNAAALIFMLCITSFTVVLVLGGGPRATTLEVALYQALAFDFDIARAMALAGLQIAITGLAVWFMSASTTKALGFSIAAARDAVPLVSFRGLAKWASASAVLIAFLFVASPLMVVVVRGAGAISWALLLSPQVVQALTTSIVLGIASGTLAILLTFGIGQGLVSLAARRRHSGSRGVFERILADAPSLVLVLPPIVLAAGWFIALRPVLFTYDVGPPVLVAINAIMAMPFAARFIIPAMVLTDARYGRLCTQLGLVGWDRFRLVSLPLLKRVGLIGFCFAFALSIGDLGVIALFGSRDFVTLPFLIFQNLGSYRSSDAAGLALMLAMLIFATMALSEWLSAHGEEQE